MPAGCRAGAGKGLHWQIPEGTRGANGELLRDDFVMADALVVVLDQMIWEGQTKAVFVPREV